MSGLLDTSVIIAVAEGQSVALPAEAAVSAMTLAELHVGVLRARTGSQRAGRLRTVAVVEREFEVLPIEERVARCFGEVVAAAREAGRRPGVADVLIAATAIVHQLPLYTCDDDFDGLEGVEVVRADRSV
ncbi:MAG TPA: PIN domain-containing protein [Solirubrobacteraceae bacterium]|nr:PIN domain-containing protein [Solirubrobacteraceae bacterium]